MEVLPTRSQIRASNFVAIETKENQGTGRLIHGVVYEILTSDEHHPYGIKVRLFSNHVGRVKKVIQGNKVVKSKTFVNLDEKQIPESEDILNEFKKYYQYDDKMDELIQDLEKNKIIENMKRKSQQRIAEAVAAFANSQEGGFLYIGVDDQGNKCGLEKDLKLGGFANYTDDFANHLNSRLIEYLKKKSFISTNLRIKFCKIENETICITQILPADEPIHLHIDGQVIFPVRGPAPRVQRLSVLEQLDYIKKRFPGA